MPRRKSRKPASVGDTYRRRYKGRLFTLEVVSTDGVVRFKVGKELFRSPSGAAKSIVKREVNGWRFWEMDE